VTGSARGWCFDDVLFEGTRLVQDAGDGVLNRVEGSELPNNVNRLFDHNIFEERVLSRCSRRCVPWVMIRPRSVGNVSSSVL